MIEEAQYPPIIGDWYRDDLGQLFGIVAVDERDGTIEVQFQGGAVAEYDLDAWEAMACVPPPRPRTGMRPMTVRTRTTAATTPSPPCGQAPSTTWKKWSDNRSSPW